MTYVLKRKGDGEYVSAAGVKRSYTTKRNEAAEFKTILSAERDVCGDEEVWFSDEYPVSRAEKL